MDARLVAANAAIVAGKRGEAVDLIITALEDGIIADIEVYRILLTNLLTLQRYAEGATWVAKALELDPASYELLNYQGIVLRRCGRFAEALAALDRAIALRPMEPAALVNKGNICNDISDGAAAERIFSRLAKQDPKNAAFQRSLGLALRAQGRLDEAESRMRAAVTLQKNNLDAWLDLSSILLDSGKPEASLELLDEARAANPDASRLMRAKSETYRRLGRTADARQFLETLPDRMAEEAWYHHELGRLLGDSDRPLANQHYRRALALEPDNTDALFALAESLDRTRHGNEGENVEEAYGLLKKAALPAQLAPGQLKVMMEIFTRSADFEAAAKLGNFRQLGRIWANTSQQGALLLQMARVETAEDRRELVDQHRLWGDTIIERARRNPICRPAPAARSSKIRLGFMSSDLRNHVVTHFAWPLFEHADRDRFDIFCYSFFGGRTADAVQQFLASRVNAFRWHPSIGDREAAQMIAEDQLDILFEVGGATHMNKIEVMAWKPARLGVSWLAYPHSAGLDTIDHLLVDPYLHPPDPALLIEKPLFMPHSWIAMGERAYPEHQIETPAPIHRNGHISFGTANAPYKYNVRMLRTWARVMARVPGSRFIFVRPEAGSRIFAENVRRHFAAEGVAGDRIEFRAIRHLHMPHYNDIDIALDTFPQTGGTTTCDALWMGVPTVSLVGEALFERLSYSILNNAGLGDLCASTVEQYVDVAVDLAGDGNRIQALRAGLRNQIKASPLGRTRQFAEDFYDLVERTVGRATGTPPLP